MGVVRSAPQCLASVRGSVYVLRYLSEDDQVSSVTHLHKIGSTSRTADARVAGAEKHATFLNAPVEVLADFWRPYAGGRGARYFIDANRVGNFNPDRRLLRLQGPSTGCPVHQDRF